MKRFSPKILALLISEMALLASLGCAQKSTTLTAGGGSSQGATVVVGDQCDTELVVTLLAHVPAVGVRIGDTISFEVSASGCTGSYVAVKNDGSVIPLVNGKTFYPVTYNAVANNVFERVQVQSLDTRGAIKRLSYATSALFDVQPIFGCSVTANPNTMGVPTDYRGVQVADANFNFQVTTTQLAELYRVESGGSEVVVPGFPTAESLNHSVPIAFRTIGTREFVFNVRQKSLGNQTASCRISVVTTVQTISAPVITSYVAEPSELSLGQSFKLKLSATAEGSSPSVSLGGTFVSYVGGNSELTVTPTQVGASYYQAVVSSQGGIARAQVLVKLAPTCTLTPTVASASVGSPYPIQVRINGSFTTASLVADGLESKMIDFNANGVQVTVSPLVTAARGNQVATLTVTGFGSTRAVCTTNVNLN